MADPFAVGAGVKAVESPTHQADATFSLAVWQRGSPTPGTSAIVADAAGPGVDSAEPVATRLVACTAKRGAILNMGTGPVLAMFARGGTSVVLQPWFKDDTLGLWMKYGGAVTITLSASNVGTATIRGMIGAKFYVQIVTVTGTVTEVGYDFT